MPPLSLRAIRADGRAAASSAGARNAPSPADGGFANVPARVPGQLIVEGTLSADGTRIEGTISQNHVTWNWSLTNQL